MRRSLLFWLLLLLLWFILGYWLCKKYICNPAPAVVAAAPVEKESCDIALIKDASAFDSKGFPNIRFLESSFSNLTYGTSTDNALKGAAEYLSNNANRSLTITGRYLDGENYSGALTDMGMARATTIKNILTGMGVPAGQINVSSRKMNSGDEICEVADSRTDAQIRDAIAAGDGGTAVNGAGAAAGSLIRIDTFNNGIGYSFGDAVSDDGRLAAIKERLFGKPITLYFDTNSDDPKLTAQIRQDFTDLNYYLSRVPEASLAVGGHTDSRGGSSANRKLSRDRAASIQQYIVRNVGINNDRMSSEGFGKANPVATNDTSEGRALNRRVEVILK